MTKHTHMTNRNPDLLILNLTVHKPKTDELNVGKCS